MLVTREETPSLRPSDLDFTSLTRGEENAVCDRTPGTPLSVGEQATPEVGGVT